VFERNLPHGSIHVYVASILDKKSRCMYHIIREVTEIELHPNNMNRKDGFSLSMSWEPHIHTLKEQNNVLLKDKAQISTSFGLPLHWS
jgi:hypothetical protein